MVCSCSCEQWRQRLSFGCLLILFYLVEGRILEVELCTVSRCCLWHHSIWVPPGALSNVPNPGRIVVVLFLGKSLAAWLTFASMHNFAPCDVLCFPMPFSCCALAGLSSGFLPSLSRPSGWGQSSERGQEPAKPGDAFGDLVRQKSAPAGLFPSVSRLHGRAGFEGFPYSQFEPGQESAHTMRGWLRRLGFLVGSNSGWTWWCGKSLLCTPWRGQLVLWYLVVAVVAMCLYGCSAWVRFMGVSQVCDWRVVLLPCSCSRESGLLPSQEVESFTGHSPSWSSRHLAGFCKPWLKAAFLLRAVLLLNLGAKCFDERGGNLSRALLILVPLGAFQSHSKLLQLDKQRHQVVQCVVWQTSLYLG